MDILNTAIITAVKYHNGQLDKVGEPYILHPIRVMLSCTSIDYKVVAILHDVIEDTELNIDQLQNKLIAFPKKQVNRIIEAICAITKIKNESYNLYLNRVKDNPIATYVKIVDIKDNMSPVRTFQLEYNTQIRLAKKYQYALTFLNE